MKIIANVMSIIIAVVLGAVIAITLLDVAYQNQLLDNFAFFTAPLIEEDQ